MTTSRSRRNAAPAPELPVPAAVDLQATIDAHAAESQAQLTQLIEQQHAAIAPSEPVEAAPAAPAAPAREWGPYFTEAEANLILSTMRETDVAAPFSKRWRFLLPLADTESTALRQALNDHSISYREGLDLKQAVAAGKTLAGAVIRAQVGYGLAGVEVRL